MFIKIFFLIFLVNLFLHNFGSGFQAQFKFSFKLFIIYIWKEIKFILKIVVSFLCDKSRLANFLTLHSLCCRWLWYWWRLTRQRSAFRISFFRIIDDDSLITFLAVNDLILCCHWLLIPSLSSIVQVLACDITFICLFLPGVHLFNTFEVCRNFLHGLFLVLLRLF